MTLIGSVPVDASPHSVTEVHLRRWLDDATLLTADGGYEAIRAVLDFDLEIVRA